MLVVGGGGIRRIAVAGSVLIAVISTFVIELAASCVVVMSVNFETIIRLPLSLELSLSVLCSNKTWFYRGTCFHIEAHDDDAASSLSSDNILCDLSDAGNMMT
jgi:hypothetical protein